MKNLVLIVIGIAIGCLGNFVYGRILYAQTIDDIQNNLADICSELEL